MQYFNGDDREKQFEACAKEILDLISEDLDAFYEDAYDSQPLGDVLHMGTTSPLSNAIDLRIFRETFNTIYTAFTVSGTFESYLTVFRKIFGDDVDVEFTVPAPGKLNIDIIADELEIDGLLVRHIESNAYVFDNLIWGDGGDPEETGRILVQSVKGFHSQYELEQMLFEMVPAGVFTQISLTFG